VASTGQVGGIEFSANCQFGAVHEWRAVANGELAVVGQLEGVRGAAAATALASDGERRTASIVRAGRGDGQLIVHLVVADRVKVLVEAGLHGAVHGALGPVEGELLAGQVHLAGVKAELGADVHVLGVDDAVEVELVAEVAAGVEVGLRVAPVHLELRNVWNWHAVHWGGEAGGELGTLLVLDLVGDAVLARSECALDAHAWHAWAGHLALVAAADGATLQCAFRRELETVALAGELYFVVFMLKALLEEVIALLGKISVLDWHG